MKRKMLPLLLLVCCLFLGCGEKSRKPSPPEQTAPPEAIPAPTPVSTPAPTAEPTAKSEEEPTATPEPTPTAAPVAETLHLLYNGTEVNSLTAKENTSFVLSSNAAGQTGDVTYTSDNEAVAKIDPQGKVIAVAPGNATITVRAGDQSGRCKVTVTKAVKPTVSICFLNTPKSDITMNASNNETVQLSAVVTPADSGRRVIWSSTDPLIAEVDEKGLVTAISQGTCEVVCQCGEAAARCWVRVKGQRISYAKAPDADGATAPAVFITCGGYVNPDFTIQVGESVNMDYELVLAEDTDVSWSIANPAIASVDQNGVVTGIKKGNTTLTVSCGSLSYSSTVRVKG